MAAKSSSSDSNLFTKRELEDIDKLARYFSSDECFRPGTKGWINWVDFVSREENRSRTTQQWKHFNRSPRKQEIDRRAERYRLGADGLSVSETH